MKEISNPLVLPRAAREGDSGGTHWQVHYMNVVRVSASCTYKFSEDPPNKIPYKENCLPSLLYIDEICSGFKDIIATLQGWISDPWPSCLHWWEMYSKWKCSYLIYKMIPNFMGLSYVTATCNVMDLSYMLSFMGLSYVPVTHASVAYPELLRYQGTHALVQ